MQQGLKGYCQKQSPAKLTCKLVIVSCGDKGIKESEEKKMLEIKISVNVKGLDRLADALFAIAGINAGAEKEVTSNVTETVASQQPENTHVQEVETQSQLIQAAQIVPDVSQTAPAIQTTASNFAETSTVQTVQTAAQAFTTPVSTMQTTQAIQTAQTVPAVAVPVSPTGAVPVNVPSYSMDDLTRAAMTLMDAGKQSDLQALLASFGVESLPQLPPEQYGAFATGMRGMGAKI